MVATALVSLVGWGVSAALPAGASTSRTVARSQASAARGIGDVVWVSCPSNERCWAAAVQQGGAALVLTSSDGGTTWSIQSKPKGMNGFAALDCANTSHCWAVGRTASGKPVDAFVRTGDGGKSWSEEAVPKSVYALQSISCVGDARCWAVGIAPTTLRAVVIATADNGKTWRTEKTPELENGMSNPFGIDCANESSCVVVGSDAVLTTNDGGTHWSRHSIARQALDNVSCPSVKDCVADGNVTSAIPQNESASLVTSRNGGSTWQVRVKKAPGVLALSGLSCASTSRCLAVGGGYAYHRNAPIARRYTFFGVVERTTNGGRTWRREVLATAGRLSGVSCASGSQLCVAVGEKGTAGLIYRSVDGGRTWTKVTPLGA